MTVKELIEKLSKVEDQNAQIIVSAGIEYTCLECGTKEEYRTQLEFIGVDKSGCLSVYMNDN